MYEPIRNKSVHAMAAETDMPHRSREEELDIRLAGHLTALLTVTDELRALGGSPALDDSAERLAGTAARLRGGREPQRAAPSARDAGQDRLTALHQRAHTLAGMALVIATSREDEAAAELAAECLERHAEVLGPAGAA
ncbi:hypothetical protein [Streptomyces sp. TR06-5]|uniref:SCO4983 family protein n=1 Tax=unclassified Streptomyces TaxID=2593676 RepID=UPI00399FDF73